MKTLLILLGVSALIVLFNIQDKINKPVYNKMYNVWHEDEKSKQLSRICTIGIITIAFVLGLLF